MTDILIISTPFQYTPGPALAPALLRACLEQDNITANTWDLAAEFNSTYKSHSYYDSVITWMQSPEVQLTSDEFNWYTNIITEYSHKILNHYQPKSLAISVMTMSGQRFTEDICFHIKKASNTRIIIGGSGINVMMHQFNLFWYQLLLDAKMVDTVIIGEGELAISHVITNNISGCYTQPQLTNNELAQIPVPNYDDYDLSIYHLNDAGYISYFHKMSGERIIPWTITASKGCVRNCTFCDVNRIWSKFRFRPGHKVAEEIISLHQKYGASYFSFTDSLINGGLRPLFDMNQVLVDTIPNTIRYESQAVFRGEYDMPEKYFDIMAQAGCYHVNIGLESGSEEVRNHMGKRVTDKDILYSASMFLKYNILQTWNIVVGYPTESNEDFQKTIELINYWYDRSEGKIHFIPVDTFLMLDGVPMTTTDLYTQLEIHQDLINGYSDFSWVSNINPTNTYDVRAQRFIEVCELIKEKTSYQSHIVNNLNQRISRTQKRLNWYYEHKQQKKIFSISQV